MIIIFTYNRPEMLLRLLRECPAGEQVIALDDGSDYDPSEHMKLCRYIRTQHWGKMGFWQKWQYAFDLCQNSTDEYFTFLADDMREVEWHRLARIPDKLYAQNLMFERGRIRDWTGLGGYPEQFNGEPHYMVGYVDCAYQTNRMTMEQIGWKQDEVEFEWFMAGPNISSGVGHHQSWRFVHNRVPMVMPSKTIAKHGNHLSQMHPEHRKKVPLIVE
jgi:hypothetical protein